MESTPPALPDVSALRGSIKEYQRLWNASLVGPLTREERLGRPPLRLRDRTARQLLGVDIYACKVLAKTYGVSSIAGLYDFFVHRTASSGIAGIAGFCQQLEQVAVSADKARELAAQCEQLHSAVAAHHLDIQALARAADEASELPSHSRAAVTTAPEAPESAARDAQTAHTPHTELAAPPGSAGGADAARQCADEGPGTAGNQHALATSATSEAWADDASASSRAADGEVEPQPTMIDTHSRPADAADGPTVAALPPVTPKPRTSLSVQRSCSDSQLPAVGAEGPSSAGPLRGQVSLLEYFARRDSMMRKKRVAVRRIRAASPVALVSPAWDDRVQARWSPSATLRSRRRARLAPLAPLDDVGSGIDEDFEAFESAVVSGSPDILRPFTSPSALWATKGAPLGKETASRDSYVEACRTQMELPVRTVLQRLGDREVHLPHFGMGPTASQSLASALASNRSITLLNLTGNTLSQRGTAGLAAALRRNNSLVRIDLSNCGVGVAAYDLFRSLEFNSTLRQLSLKGNHIPDVATRNLGRCLAANTSLSNLDVSFNKLSDGSAGEVAQLLSKESSSALRTLNMKWNKVSHKGAAAIARQLQSNSTLLLLDLSWNSVGLEGGLSFGECLAFNQTLRVLDLSQNRIPYRAAVIIADALRLNTGLSELSLSYNPIGRAGATAVIQALSANKTIHKWGLTGIDDAKLQPTFVGVSYDPLNSNGHYRLNLADPWDHAVATMLHARKVFRMALWHRATLGRKPVPDSVMWDPEWVVPRSGRLKLDFVAAEDASDQHLKQRPVVHFKLDLSKPDEHRLARTLVVRAIEEPGENFLRESIDGVPFQFSEEDDGVGWIDQMHEGVLEVDYLSTALAHEAHYVLDLSKPSDHAVASKLLERVYVTMEHQDHVHGDRWVNPTVDGVPVKLVDWRRGKLVGDTWVSGASVKARGVKSAWRVPMKGILRFDFESPNPQHVFTQHYKLDLEKPQERAIADDLRVRASIVPGDNWWNETIDGVPFSLSEGFGDDSGSKFLPRRGILEVDYVVTRPQESAKNMIRDHFSLDLAIPAERKVAIDLRQRAIASLFSAVREAEQLDQEAEEIAAEAAKAEARAAAQHQRDLARAERREKRRAVRRKRKAEAAARRQARRAAGEALARRSSFSGSSSSSESSSSSDPDTDDAADELQPELETKEAPIPEPHRIPTPPSVHHEPALDALPGPETTTAHATAATIGRIDVPSSPPDPCDEEETSAAVVAPVQRSAPVVSDDEEEHEPVKVQPKKLFASLGFDSGLTRRGEEAKRARKPPPPARRPRRRSKHSVLANLTQGFQGPGVAAAKPAAARRKQARAATARPMMRDRKQFSRPGQGARLLSAPSSHGASKSLRRMPSHTTLHPSDLGSLMQFNTKAALQDTPGDDEMIMNATLDGEQVSGQALISADYTFPTKGKLEFDFVTFRGSDVMSPRDHHALLDELKRQTSDIERFHLLQLVLQGSADTAVFFNCDMARVILQCFTDVFEMRAALQVLQPRLRDPHRVGELVEIVETAEKAERVVAMMNTPSGKKKQKKKRMGTSSSAPALPAKSSA